MSDKPQSVQPQAVGGNYSRAADFHHIFSNQSRIRIAPGEFTFVFGFIDESPVGPIYTEESSVSMTANHARRMSVILSEMLKEYERVYGNIPPDTNVPIDGARIMERVEKILSGNTSD